jgi:hypothetical protein
MSTDFEMRRDGDEYLGEVQDRELPLSTAIVYAVADVRDEDPLSLTPPLSSIVDVDALDQLFEGRSDAPLSSISFTLWGCQVTVAAPERIHVERVWD